MIFSGIKIIIWDFDGTLYPHNKQVSDAMEEGQYKTIMRRMGWSREKAKKEFWDVYPSTTTSGNAAVAMICDISVAEAAIENESSFDRRQYVSRDEKLIEMFSNLKGYKHYILGNGVKKNLVETSQGLGIDGVFEEIVTSEVSGANKPDPAGFLYIMNKSGMKPEEHLMIGDREAVDLEPAKKLGMRTCLVTWGKNYEELPQSGVSVDMAIQTVYDLPPMIG